MKHDCIAFCMLLGIEMIPGFLTCQPVPWRNLDKGLMMAEVKPDVSSRVGDSKITILRIDPRYFSFQLMCASEIGTPRMTAKQWCRGKNLVAAVNAGMFQTDGYTNVGYMKNFGHINNSRMNNYNSILAFNPVDSTLPGIRMIDRQCNELAALKDKYNTLIQNERMIDCHRRNVWTQQKRKWSMVALGVDQSGSVLFLFTRTAYSVHDFIDILLSLPISISSAMYLEGGPEASLYLSVNGTEIEKFGSYETGFNENDNNNSAWPIPTVIGIVKKGVK